MKRYVFGSSIHTFLYLLILHFTLQSKYNGLLKLKTLVTTNVLFNASSL